MYIYTYDIYICIYEERLWGDPRPRHHQLLLQDKSFNLKLFGNEGYCTHASLLLIKIMMCSQLHFQKLFNLKLFSYFRVWGLQGYLAHKKTQPPGTLQ